MTSTLDENATDDVIDAVEYEDIHSWVSQYLPPESAQAFADWMNDDIGDWGNPDITVRVVLTGAYARWTGRDMPNP